MMSMGGKNAPRFERYIGIDYSGARTPSVGLTGIRVYAVDARNRRLEPAEITPPAGTRKHWSRRALADWLVEVLGEVPPTLVGIDHGFSFPMRYFEELGVPGDWTMFLRDFQRHWPTDAPDMYVDFIREGVAGAGAARSGSAKWRRLADVRARAKSVFHFDVPGSVAKSTHAGLPWLLHLREQLGARVHFWPFDGWEAPAGRSLVVEAYPSQWSAGYPRGDRTPDQHDAYATAAWMRDTDADGRLAHYLKPDLTPEERETAEVEGWILGVK